MKYIIVKKGSVEYGIVFPDEITHHDVARVCRAADMGVVSAGFCLRRNDRGWATWGRSESLDLDSREFDAGVLAQSFPDLD